MSRPKALEVRFAVRPHLALIDQPQRSAYQRFAAHEDVGGHIEVVQNVKFLVDKTDAQGDRVRDAGNGDLFSVKEDLPFVRLVDAAEGLHQRRLARAVLADQGHHLGLADRETYVA